MMLLVVLLAQAGPPPVPYVKDRTPPPNVRCVPDSFGHLTCSDGSRVLKDSNGGFTVIPGRR